MPATVIVGGQFGSEGKGKASHFLALLRNAATAVRVGGSNSGHHVVSSDGKSYMLRQLPTAAVEPGTMAVIGAGSLVDPDILLDEIDELNLGSDRLLIDPEATIITAEHKAAERATGLTRSIGSTGSGTGAAVAARISRKAELIRAKHDARLRPYTMRGTAASFLRSVLRRGERVIIEGTQGFGLSLTQSAHYPYVTSRDTTAATFVAEAGISPRDVDEVAMVVRTYPIRVPGNSGELRFETQWGAIEGDAGWPVGEATEFTSVTKMTRRVGAFDAELVRCAIEVNAPDIIILNHVDLFDYMCNKFTTVTPRAKASIETIENHLGSRFDYYGLSPSVTIPVDEVGTLQDVGS